MKIAAPLCQLLLAIVALSTSSAQETSVTFDLNELQISHKAKASLTGTSPIVVAPQYVYAFTATVRGTAELAEAIPSGTSLAAALDALNAESFPLTGSVLTAKGKLPITVMKEKLESDSILISIKANTAISIDKQGGVKFKLRNTSVKSADGGASEAAIIFEEGSTLTVSQAVAATSSPRPDIILPDGSGNDLYEDPASEQVLFGRSPVNKAKTFSFFVQNDSSTAQTYTLTLPTNEPFNQAIFKYVVDGEEVSGSSTSLTMDPLDFVEVKVKATPKPNSPLFDAVEVSPRVSGGGASDRIRIGVQRQ